MLGSYRLERATQHQLNQGHCSTHTKDRAPTEIKDARRQKNLRTERRWEPDGNQSNRSSDSSADQRQGPKGLFYFGAGYALSSSASTYNTTSKETSTMYTTLEAATEFGYFTQKQAAIFLKQHDLTWEEATADLSDSALDAHELCLWIGY